LRALLYLTLSTYGYEHGSSLAANSLRLRPPQRVFAERRDDDASRHSLQGLTAHGMARRNDVTLHLLATWTPLHARLHTGAMLTS